MVEVSIEPHQMDIYKLTCYKHIYYWRPITISWHRTKNRFAPLYMGSYGEYTKKGVGFPGYNKFYSTDGRAAFN
jgi:hypothetical protein